MEDFELSNNRCFMDRPPKVQRFTRKGFILVELQVCNFNENEQLYRYFSNINFAENIWCKNKVETLEADMRCFYFLFLHYLCVFVFIFFHRKGFSWLNKTMKVLPEFKSPVVCWRNCLYQVPFLSESKTIIERTFKLATV